MTPQQKKRLEKIARKIVIQSPEHANNIVDYFKIIIEAVDNEFVEDARPTRDAFLTELLARAIEERTTSVDLPTKVYSRDGTEVGIPTGDTHPCSMESCRGTCITVRWKDDSLTYPCSKGMDWKRDGSAKII